MPAIPLLTIARWTVGIAASYTFGRALSTLVGPSKSLLAKAGVFVGTMMIGSAVERVVEHEFDRFIETWNEARKQVTK